MPTTNSTVIDNTCDTSHVNLKESSSCINESPINDIKSNDDSIVTNTTISDVSSEKADSSIVNSSQCNESIDKIDTNNNTTSQNIDDKVSNNTTFDESNDSTSKNNSKVSEELEDKKDSSDIVKTSIGDSTSKNNPTVSEDKKDFDIVKTNIGDSNEKVLLPASPNVIEEKSTPSNTEVEKPSEKTKELSFEEQVSCKRKFLVEAATKEQPPLKVAKVN